MRSILEEFAYGNVSLETKIFTSDSDYREYKEAVRMLDQNEEKLLKKLSGEEKDIFQKYIEAQGDVDHLTVMKSLVHGYKLGVVMTAEAFVKSEELIAG